MISMKNLISLLELSEEDNLTVIKIIGDEK